MSRSDDSCELAWAAGVFEATGTATPNGRQPMLNVKQGQIVPGETAQMLTRFCRAVGGVGKLRGRAYHDCRTNRTPFHMWYAYGDDARQVIELLWPWLGDTKRNQWADCLSRVA